MSGVPLAALHTLNPVERNFLILLANGGPSAVTSELGYSPGAIDAERARIEAKLRARTVAPPAAPAPHHDFTEDAPASAGHAPSEEGVQSSAAPAPPAAGDEPPDQEPNGGPCRRSSPPAGGPQHAKAGADAPASTPGLDLDLAGGATTGEPEAAPAPLAKQPPEGPHYYPPFWDDPHFREVEGAPDGPRVCSSCARELLGEPRDVPVVVVTRDVWDRVMLRSRRRRALLLDALQLLGQPGPQEVRRDRLANRIRDLLGE